MPVEYTTPALCTYDNDLSKAWFVYFDVTDKDTGESVRKQFRGGINYYKDLESRKREGKALVSYWRKRLETGTYNPFNRKAGNPPPGSISEAVQQIIEIKKKTLKRTSRTSYRTITAIFLKWLEASRLSKLKIHSFTVNHAQSYLDHLILEKEYNNTTHNNHIKVLHAVFGGIVSRWKSLMPENPFAIQLLQTDVGKNLAYTVKEKEVLIKYLKEHNKRIFYAVSFTYHGYVRKTELCELTVGHIDWESRTIRIDSGSAKNRKQESVTITDGLHQVLLEMGLDMAPKEYYIFGRGLQTCEHRCKRPNVISDLHRELKLAAGLPDDDKAFYSWKHTGVIDYFKAIKDIYAVMRQCRHSDLKTTMIYLKSLGLNPNTEFRNAQVYL